MKPTFIHRLVNDPFEDPLLYVRIVREKRAMLFDAGNINRLKPGDLQKITDVFVTHTHIDHFIGFDTLIRALLRRETPLRVYGPSNIADCVEGKLKGYTWNLIREYPLKIEVFSVNSDRIFLSSFLAQNCFARSDHVSTEFSGTLLKEPLLTVKAVQLDHQVPCLGFSLEEEFHININKASLNQLGLPVGPWLSELKYAIREKRPDDTVFIIAGKKYQLGELKAITKTTEGQKISYVTDISMNSENIGKVIDFVRGSDTFYCEAYFMEKDRDRAAERFHLTARLTGVIARQAGVRNLVVMHFSPKYRNKTESPKDEAIEAFRNPAV
ncbi:MAG: MBL fold metallo-hydrolase [Nitrospirota bacterium]